MHPSSGKRYMPFKLPAISHALGASSWCKHFLMRKRLGAVPEDQASIQREKTGVVRPYIRDPGLSSQRARLQVRPLVLGSENVYLMRYL